MALMPISRYMKKISNKAFFFRPSHWIAILIDRLFPNIFSRRNSPSEAHLTVLISRLIRLSYHHQVSREATANFNRTRTLSLPTVLFWEKKNWKFDTHKRYVAFQTRIKFMYIWKFSLLELFEDTEIDVIWQFSRPNEMKNLYIFALCFDNSKLCVKIRIQCVDFVG